MTRTAGLSALLLVLGLVVLGARWEGIEVAPGVWRDAVSLQQWAWLWAALTVGGAVAAGWLSRWPFRVCALAPLLAWIAWSLRGGTLTPLAFVIYAVPTITAWCGGLALGDVLRHLARSTRRGAP